MQEKNITMNDAFQVWWFIIWRATLTLVVVAVGLSILMKLIHAGVVVSQAANYVSLIISVLVSVYYTKLSINRNYKGFRLSSVTK